MAAKSAEAPGRRPQGPLTDGRPSPKAETQAGGSLPASRPTTAPRPYARGAIRAVPERAPAAKPARLHAAQGRRLIRKCPGKCARSQLAMRTSEFRAVGDMRRTRSPDELPHCGFNSAAAGPNRPSGGITLPDGTKRDGIARTSAHAAPSLRRRWKTSSGDRQRLSTRDRTAV